ncbi:retinol dehydrogenase 11-like [Anthonomus grandis grandis]|uniref:retinol dehydrogenase 11-like n=1 Tax=Anthonomus grandis grandis TaxID=2921223 RepID=UPI002165D968|nr:retinol dehydrogenase 11-like [Anthonomus grandis grandis]
METWIDVLLCIVLILLVLKLYLKLTTGWCNSQVNLLGKTVIITGANTGIGYETAADLAKRGATVILACRNEEKAKKAVQQLITETDNRHISYKLVDLSSMKSVRRFADDINNTLDRLDVLINNGGLHRIPGAGFTEDGLQPIMATNYFGHWLLTHLLMDLLKKSSPSRVVNVASVAGSLLPLKAKNLNGPGLTEHDPYARSKLANVLFTIELAKRLQGTGVTTYSLHPGVILSEFTRNIPLRPVVNLGIRLFFKDVIEGAQTTIHCAVAKGIEKYSGENFHDCQKVGRYLFAKNPDLATAVWKKTEELLNINNA